MACYVKEKWGNNVPNESPITATSNVSLAYQAMGV